MDGESSNEWSPREREILRALAEGLSNREIGARLGLAVDTVRWYNKRLFDRLDATNRRSAVAEARERGLLDQMRGDDHSPVIWSPIAFVDNDGCTIAYQVVGSGPIDILFVHGFLSHLEVALDQPEYVAFFTALGRQARVIIFDKRGTGLSDRSKGAPTLEDTIADMQAVLSAVGVQRAVIMGTSEGGAAALLFASMHAARTLSLVLIGATARVARLGAEPLWAQPMAMLDASVRNWRASWGEPTSLDRFAPQREHDPAFRLWWGRALRSASSPSSIQAVIESAARVDIRALLTDIRARTLVLHRTGDQIVPVDAGRYLGRKLPNARYVELPGADHIYFVDHDPMVNAIVSFLNSSAVEPVPATWIAIMLQMGGSGALLTDEQRIRLAEYGARYVSDVDGGWTALFDTSQHAIGCARALSALGKGRTGAIALHVGECAIADGRPLWAARAVTDRLLQGAKAGEILLSPTLHDILNGGALSATPRLAPGAAGESGPVEAWLLRPS